MAILSMCPLCPYLVDKNRSWYQLEESFYLRGHGGTFSDGHHHVIQRKSHFVLTPTLPQIFLCPIFQSFFFQALIKWPSHLLQPMDLTYSYFRPLICKMDDYAQCMKFESLRGFCLIIIYQIIDKQQFLSTCTYLPSHLRLPQAQPFSSSTSVIRGLRIPCSYMWA